MIMICNNIHYISIIVVIENDDQEIDWSEFKKPIVRAMIKVMLKEKSISCDCVQVKKFGIKIKCDEVSWL